MQVRHVIGDQFVRRDEADRADAIAVPTVEKYAQRLRLAVAVDDEHRAARGVLRQGPEDLEVADGVGDRAETLHGPHRSRTGG